MKVKEKVEKKLEPLRILVPHRTEIPLEGLQIAKNYKSSLVPIKHQNKKLERDTVEIEVTKRSEQLQINLYQKDKSYPYSYIATMPKYLKPKHLERFGLDKLQTLQLFIELLQSWLAKDEPLRNLVKKRIKHYEDEFSRLRPRRCFLCNSLFSPKRKSQILCENCQK